MWPYGYTLTNVPPDMTVADHTALWRIGRHMAATNGYRAEQASDLYITRGTTKDYAYGVYRIFAYTFEMSVKDYVKPSMIGPETKRNKEAVLYLMERAGCLYAVLGAAARVDRCGAFDDDLEVARGWTVNPDGTDTAPSAGRFARGNPQPTSSSGPKQLGTTPSGRDAFVTGWRAGAKPNSSDLDGLTTIRSAPIDAAGEHRPAAQVPLLVRPRLEVDVGRQADARSSRRRTGRRRRSGASPGDRPTATAPGAPPRSRSTRGPARRSTSASRPSTAVRTTWSRSRSTTSVSASRRDRPGRTRG